MNQLQFKKVSHLNNRGIVYLEAEMYHHAAAYFKKASKLLIAPDNSKSAETSGVTDSKPRAIAAFSSLHHGSHSHQGESAKKDAIIPRRIDGEKHLDTQQSTPLPNKRRTDPVSQPRKRRRPSSERMNKEESPEFVIGRPFWLTEDSRAVMVSVSSILLYNLGLNYHLQALRDPTSGKNRLKRAMGIYEMAQKLAWKSPGPILLLSLHNIHMSQIHHYRGNHSQAILMSRELCKILRVIHVGIDGYEKFYLRMLSLQSRNLAPAA